MMWRKTMDDGTVIVAPTVEGPGFSLGPNDTVGVDGWEPVPDSYAVPEPDRVAALEAQVDALIALLAGG